jgi:hypothetical protein
MNEEEIDYFELLNLPVKEHFIFKVEVGEVRTAILCTVHNVIERERLIKRMKIDSEETGK